MPRTEESHNHKFGCSYAKEILLGTEGNIYVHDSMRTWGKSDELFS
jgi:hypothetical protein